MAVGFLFIKFFKMFSFFFLHFVCSFEIEKGFNSFTFTFDLEVFFLYFQVVLFNSMLVMIALLDFTQLFRNQNVKIKKNYNFFPHEFSFLSFFLFDTVDVGFFQVGNQNGEMENLFLTCFRKRGARPVSDIRQA